LQPQIFKVVEPIPLHSRFLALWSSLLVANPFAMGSGHYSKDDVSQGKKIYKSFIISPQPLENSITYLAEEDQSFFWGISPLNFPGLNATTCTQDSWAMLRPSS